MKRFLLQASLVVISGTLLCTSLFMSGCGGGGGSSPATPAVPPTVSPIVPPLPIPGPFAVACSNVSQDFSRVAPGGDAKAYWEGTPSSNGTPRYVTDLLSDPANTLSVTVTTPNDGNLYGSYVGRNVAYVVLACYPTAANNPNANYPLPTGVSVPHMQTGATPPLFADAAAVVVGVRPRRPRCRRQYRPLRRPYRSRALSRWRAAMSRRISAA